MSSKLGLGVGWATPGRLFSRAFLGGGVCERCLRVEPAHFRADRCRRSQTWGEYAFLRSTSIPIRPNHVSFHLQPNTAFRAPRPRTACEPELKAHSTTPERVPTRRVYAKLAKLGASCNSCTRREPTFTSCSTRSCIALPICCNARVRAAITSRRMQPKRTEQS